MSLRKLLPWASYRREASGESLPRALGEGWHIMALVTLGAKQGLGLGAELPKEVEMSCLRGGGGKHGIYWF